MKKSLAFLALSSIYALACGANQNQSEGNTMITVDALKQFKDDAVIWNTAAAVNRDCQGYLKLAKDLRDQLVAAHSTDAKGTLDQLNLVYQAIDHVYHMAGLMANVHPNEDLRNAAEVCEQNAQKLATDLSLDHELYEAIASLDVSTLDALAQRFYNKTLRDYKRSGVDKDEQTRQQLKKLSEEITKVGQEFDRNIRDDKQSITVRVEDLKGLPQDFIDAHKPDANGDITITTDYPDYMPVQTYADKESVRKALYVAKMNIGYPSNRETFQRLLALRYAYATTLGYKSWADYNVADKMAGNVETVTDLIDKISSIARPASEAELKKILARKQKDDPSATVVQNWDRFYYTNKIRAEEFNVDAQEVRSYFEYNHVRDGIFEVASRLYGVRFEPAKDAKKWHKDVEVYDMFEGDKHVSRFYLDTHPRANKYNHAAMFPMAVGIEGHQLPVGALVTNFPEAGSLMEYDDVTTFFHEFGHLMHHMLSGHQEWSIFSGVNCEWDFVEVPSQLNEEWAWDANILALFSSQRDTHKPIPADLVDKMKKAEEFGKGIHVMRQMYYAALSHYYYATDTSSNDPMDLVISLGDKFSPYPHLDGTYLYASFGHLNGYSSLYYTYMWSLMIGKDFYQKFVKNGIMDKDTATLYRKTVLEPGGAVDAKDMAKNFLGREPNFDAMKAWLEGK